MEEGNDKEEETTTSPNDTNVKFSISWSTNLSLCYQSGNALEISSKNDTKVKMVLIGIVMVLVSIFVLNLHTWLHKWLF